MISAILGVIIAFNALVYLVLVAFLKDRLRKPSPVHFPELTGLITKGKKRVTWARARSSLAAQSNLSSQPQGMLRRVYSFCSLRDYREELPLFSIDCTDFTACRDNDFAKMQSWPPAARNGLPVPGLPPRPPGRRAPPPQQHADKHRTLHTHSSSTVHDVSTSAADVSGLGPAAAARPRSQMLLVSAKQPTPERGNSGTALPAAEEENAAADAAEGLLRQALRMLYKQHYGVPSVMAQYKQPHQEDSPHCFLERQPSPTTPLDAIVSLPGSPPADAFTASPFYGFSPTESVCGDSVNGDVDEDPEEAGLPKLPSLDSWADLGAAPDLALQPPRSVFIVSTWRLRNE
ncbi:g5200 [Coccomyxa elongata]